MNKQKLVDILGFWKSDIQIEYLWPYYYDAADTPEQIAEEILSEMNDAWAVFDPDGEIIEHTISTKSKEAAIKKYTSCTWQVFVEDGYKCLPIKWTVCDE